MTPRQQGAVSEVRAAVQEFASALQRIPGVTVQEVHVDEREANVSATVSQNIWVAVGVEDLS